MKITFKNLYRDGEPNPKYDGKLVKFIVDDGTNEVHIGALLIGEFREEGRFAYYLLSNRKAGSPHPRLNIENQIAIRGHIFTMSWVIASEDDYQFEIVVLRKCIEE